MPDSPAYGRVFKSAQKSGDKMFTVLYKTNSGQEARLGLTIRKKNCPGAVGRNRLKRIVRESFRMHREQLQGLDLVVLNQPAAANASNKTLFDSLHRHWQRCRPGKAKQTING